MKDIKINYNIDGEDVKTFVLSGKDITKTLKCLAFAGGLTVLATAGIHLSQHPEYIQTAWNYVTGK